MLCLICARRDKVCPQYRVRNWTNTNPLQPPQKLYGHAENSCNKVLGQVVLCTTIKIAHKACFHVCCIGPIFVKFKDACTFPTSTPGQISPLAILLKPALKCVNEKDLECHWHQLVVCADFTTFARTHSSAAMLVQTTLKGNPCTSPTSKPFQTSPHSKNSYWSPLSGLLHWTNPCKGCKPCERRLHIPYKHTWSDKPTRYPTEARFEVRQWKRSTVLLTPTCGLCRFHSFCKDTLLRRHACSDYPRSTVQRLEQLEMSFKSLLHFILFLLIVGNLHCLVMLCLICMRRDKVCPQYRVRNSGDTNHPRSQQKLYGPLGNSCTISQYFFWAKLIRSLLSYDFHVLL